MLMTLLALTLALVVGKTAAFLCTKIKVSPVIGEITAGLILANALPSLPFGTSKFLHTLGEIGVILLLFSAGLEAHVSELRRVGVRAALVAVVGVFAPFSMALIAWYFGFIDGRLPDGMSSFSVPVFIGATLTATSVGITARILSDAGQSKTRTGQLILNDAVIDDVLGLLILAGVSSFVAKDMLSLVELGIISGKAALFFLVAIPFGYFVFPYILKSHAKRSVMLLIGLIVCFSYAGFGHVLGLAPIVGAFFAGLLIDDSTDKMRKTVAPLVTFLAPLFFVLIGAQVSVEVLSELGVDGLVTLAILVVLGIASKFLCAGVAGPGTDRIAVGLGMAPRGEVGFIFVATGKQLGILSDSLYALLIFAILLTTLIPSILLDLWLKRSNASAS